MTPDQAIARWLEENTPERCPLRYAGGVRRELPAFGTAVKGRRKLAEGCFWVRATWNPNQDGKRE